MARPREFDLDEAVESMTERFWAKGYEATGIADLEECTGLARARLYGAFGSKRQMLYRAIDYYLAGRIDEIFRRVDRAGIAGVIDFFQRFAKVVSTRPERAAMGCLMVNSIVELGRTDRGVVDRAGKYRERVQGAFRSALEQALRNGEIEGDIEERAAVAYMLLMGLFVSVKAGSAVGEIERMCAVATSVVDSWRIDAAQRMTSAHDDGDEMKGAAG